jgi:hypothetical protein
MARNNWSLVTTSVVALTAATAKTVLQYVNPAATLLSVIQELKISFDGISNTAVPVVVQLLRKTAAATVATAIARVKTKDTTTALVTDNANTGSGASAEGTDGGIIETWHVHPQAGAFDTLPLPDGEVQVPGSGIIAVKCNAPAGVNVLVTLKGED